MPQPEIIKNKKNHWHSFHTITPIIAILVIVAGVIILWSTKNDTGNLNANANQSAGTDTNSSPLLRGTGTIESCQFPADQQCGTCYCIQTDVGCEIIDGSAVRDLSGLVNTTVTYEANRATGCSGACQCTIKLLKVTTP